jgi:hypothetical protein
MGILADRTSSLPVELKRACLDELLASDTFARSDQLRNFLNYIGEMALSGRSREVTEYLIAVQALGRPADFSPAEDSSVRSRAHELRRKIQKYYETENPDAPIRIELPKGSYAPRFVSREQADAVTAVEEPHPSVPALPVLVEQVPRPEAPTPSRLVWILAAALALCLGASAVLAWRAAHPAPAVDPIVAEAWGPLARPDANVLVCVGTVLHMVIRPYMPKVAEGLSKYDAPPEMYPLYRQHRPLPEGVELGMHPVDNSVQLGHMSSVVAFSTTMQALGTPYQILPERSAPVTTMRDRNVIIIGDPQNSSAAAKLLEETPFTLDYDPGVQDVVVRDRRSGRGWVPKRGPDNRYTDAYGLLTVTPTPGGKRGQSTVIISGITSVGSHAAADFFTSAQELRRMKQRFQSDGIAGFPRAYQVVVRCKSSDTQLLSADYEAHAVIRK